MRLSASDMSHVHSESLGQLGCSNCNKYLSHFPVYLEPNGNAICGRCEPSSHAIHNAVFQHAVSHQQFPCCYSTYGCLEFCKPKDIPRHERLCTFRKFQCPILTGPKCEWEGFPREMLDHFETKHPIFILNESKFEIDFINSHKENYLLPYGEEFYIVNRSTDSKTNTFYCRVTYIGCNPDVEKYSYKLVMENNNKSRVHEVRRTLNTTAEISGDSIRPILNDPTSIIAQIEVFQQPPPEQAAEENTQNNNIDYDMLRELECLVCMEYMVPPIHQCVTGHSICLKCKHTVVECPTCKKEFGNTQNFALAQLINRMTYPCKHDRCTFATKAIDIKQHEATCIYSPVQCCLKDYLGCAGEMLLSEMYEHILNNHYENLLEMETITIPWDDVNAAVELIEDCYLLRYSNKLFKLHFKFHDFGFQWAMQLIGDPEQSKKYSFEIDMIDNSNNNNRVYLKSKCGPLTNKALAFTGDIKIIVNYFQVKPLITTEMSYRVRIIQNSV